MTPARSLPRDEVHLWYTCLDFRVEVGGQGVSLLSAGERDRAARFHRNADRRRYVAAHAFLRRTLAQYLSLPAEALDFVEGSAGKPALTQMPGEPDLRFSLAHCGEHALVVVALGREVGVDGELMNLDVDALALAEEVFPEAICTNLRALSGDARVRAFYRAWTRLEALLKACGAGFTYEPRQVELPLNACSPLQVDLTCGKAALAEQWTICDLVLPEGLAGAVAAEGSCWRLTYMQMDAPLR